MVNLRNYGVGIGYTSDGVTGKKSVFSPDEKIYAVHVWDDLKGDETFKIEFQRLEAGIYVNKVVKTWINQGYSAAYQFAWIRNYPAGKYRCRFLLNNIFGGGQEFTITEEEIPTPPPIVKSDVNFITHPSGANLYIDGVLKGKTNLVVKADAGSEHSYRIELEGYETISASQVWPSTGMLAREWTLKEIEIPVPPVVKTWWQKLLEFLTDSPFIGILVDENLFKSGYKLLTGKEIDDVEYEFKRLQIADWVLPINLLLKIFEGRNLKGEPEEFGSAADWLEASIYLAGAIIPGNVDETAAKIGLKTITKSQADDLVRQLGKKGIVDDLIKRVKLNPETSAKFLSKFPAEVRNAVINGLGRTAYGREVIYVLGKNNYFKYTAPGLKGFLAKVGAGPKWFAGIAGLLAGYVSFASFLAWSGKEALVETLSFPIWKLIDEEDWDGVLKHIGALRASINLADEAMILTKPIPLVSDIWKGFIDNANIQADIYEDLAKKGLAKIVETGELTVTSNIDNSDVYIDGRKVGVTPYVKILDVGKYHLLVTKFKYTSQEVDVDIVAGATPKFNAQISLIEEPPTGKGTLDISIEPTDAVLEVAGHPEINKMGAYEVDVGTYTILASAENYYDKSITAIAKEAEITDVSIVLSKKEIPLPPEEVLGTLTISVTPEDALIEVAGEEEITKAGVYDLSPGSYSVRASKNGFETKIKTAIVDEAKDTAISFTLAEITPPKPVTTKATIKITSEPTLADVYIDGEYAFTKTPYTVLLAKGSYFIRVQKDGYYPTEVEIEVEEGEVSELPLILTEIVEPEIPAVPYYPQAPYYPTYVPDVPYVPDVVTTPAFEIPPYNYSNLYPEVSVIPDIKPVSRPVEKELLINIETTDLKPWKGRIYSIALLDLSDPAAEILINVNDNEQLLIEEFLSIFNSIDPAKLVGFKLTFDYRYIFAKMMLYRMQNKRFADVGLRDVKQILDQVKEEFVYYPDKTGKLDDYGKMLLGIGKYGSQELMLRKYISGDFDYVKEFQNRQIELTRDLYNLARFSMGKAFISSPSPVSEPISTPETPLSPETPGILEKTQCPVCFSFIDKTTGKCPICEPVI